MSEPVIVIARAQIRPESHARFVVAARDCIAATRQETGCLAYDMYESLSEPGHFVSVERWDGRAAAERHMLEPHLQAFLAIAGACVTAPPVIEVVEPRSIDRL